MQCLLVAQLMLLQLIQTLAKGRYRHNVYYVSKETIYINKKRVVIPVLKRKRLTPVRGIYTETVMEGVENMRFVFGLDTTNDSRVDTYKSINQMTATDWENRRNFDSTSFFTC